MGKSLFLYPNPKTNKFKDNSHIVVSGLLKSFHFHVIEIVFVEMD